MPTRFTYPQPPGTVPTGYSNPNTVENLTIPSCGLEDVDVAVFNLFDKDINLFFSAGNETTKEQNVKRVPVVFAAGEKWAMLKRNRPLRDKNDALILPLVTISRSGIEQSSANDINGRGTNQQTGEIVIHRRLDKLDRNYQNLINKLYIVNQKNVAVNPTDVHLDDQVLTLRTVGDRKDEQDIRNGALLAPNNRNNIYETITLPAPQFFSAKYEVTIWTQYTQQMNQLIEVLMSSYLSPGSRSFKIDTPKGYWFVAYVEESYTQDVNFDDMSNSERIIKYKFTLRVPAYLLASSTPGAPVPLRRTVSSPTIIFSTDVASGDVSERNRSDSYPFLGADDPTLPSALKKNLRVDNREDGVGPLGTQAGANRDPALSSYPRGIPPGEYRRVGNSLLKVQVVSPYNGEVVYKTSLSDSETIIE